MRALNADYINSGNSDNNWIYIDIINFNICGYRTEPAKLKFESYIEERIRMLSFSLSTTGLSSTPETHYNRIRAFLKHDGAIKCYKHLVSENIVPTVWQRAIQLAFEQQYIHI